MYDNLPDGFVWQKRPYQSVPTAVAYDGIVVCVLDDRINDGGWFVRLDRHLERIDGPIGPVRDCQSYESGVAGCGLWVHRHQERLRREAGAMADALRAKNRYGAPWAGPSSSAGSASVPDPGPANIPRDPMSWGHDPRTAEEKAEAYSRELRRRRGSSRDWFKKKG